MSEKKIEGLKLALSNSEVAIKKRDIEINELKNEVDILMLRESKDKLLVASALVLLFIVEVLQWIA